MPAVQIRFNPGNIDKPELVQACREIIPAGLHSEQGNLTPGSVRVFASALEDGDDCPSDVFISVEAYFYSDRADDIEERAAAMKTAFEQIFPGVTFEVWPKLVVGGWASDFPDPEFVGSMSMESAILRVEDWLSARKRPRYANQ